MAKESSDGHLVEPIEEATSMILKLDMARCTGRMAASIEVNGQVEFKMDSEL